MNLENLDDKTSIEKDLGVIRTRFSDSLSCKFRYSPSEGGSLDMTFIPKGRGGARTCSFQINSFKAFVDILKEASNLFVEAEALAEKQSAEAKAIQQAIRQLTE